MVGDRVEVLAGGDGIVTYGPVNSTFNTHRLYVVKQDGDDERAFKVSDLKPLPKFAVGDKVAYVYGGGGTLVAGPFKSEHHDEALWVVEKPNGTHMTPTENSLTKVVAREIKVGDRVRVVRATYADHAHGTTGVVTAVGLGWRTERGDVHPFMVDLDDGGDIYVAEVELIETAYSLTFEHDGVAYDLSANYRDKDGDDWRFEAVKGTPRGGMNGQSVNEYSDSLVSVVDEFGPLTKV